MKVVLLQLPVQSHDNAYPMENLGLGVGSLKAYAQSVLPPDISIVLGPHALVNYGGDQTLVAWILSERPDVVGFSCYVWNVERSLDIARRVKAERPQVRILVGGPEVTPENDFLRSAGGFDWGVVGEGEETFVAILSALRSGHGAVESLPGLLRPTPDGWHATKPRPVMRTLDPIPSPYLSGALHPSDAGTILLETVRGCPNRCTYCYYHKRFPHVRSFSLDRLREELHWAAHRAVSEIYFVDPCFTRRKDLVALLGMIEEARRIHAFTFQCEGTAEDVTPALAHSLARAGLTQMEVGLQTVNPRALARIRRRFDPNRFIAGIRALRAAGVRVMVDVMVALPEDSLEDVKRSIDFVVENDLFDELSLYTLCLLPGTELRRQATALGMVFHAKPPYHVVRTPRMSSEDIRRAYEYAEEASGVDFFPPDLPAPLVPPEIRRLGPHLIAFPAEKTLEIFERKEPPAGPYAEAECARVAQTVSVYVSEDSVKALKDGDASRALVQIFEKNPWTLLTFVLTPKGPDFPWAVVFSLAHKVLSARDHVMDREHFSTLDPVRSVQIVALLPHPVSGRVIVRIPVPHPEESEPPVPGSRRTVDQAWVGLPEDVSAEEEAEWLQPLWPLCPPHIRRLRLGDRQ
ncbi:B12-binding domain-containing radical SAM protein [Desulfosoma sp.]